MKENRPWQDWAFLFGTLFFDCSAVVSLLDVNTKIPLFSSLSNSLICYILAYTEKTLNLKLGSLATYLNASIWLLIAIFRH